MIIIHISYIISKIKLRMKLEIKTSEIKFNCDIQ